MPVEICLKPYCSELGGYTSRSVAISIESTDGFAFGGASNQGGGNDRITIRIESLTAIKPNFCRRLRDRARHLGSTNSESTKDKDRN